jgi:hypothetical protein
MLAIPLILTNLTQPLLSTVDTETCAGSPCRLIHANSTVAPLLYR